MSIEYANLCSVVVKQVFGETVQIVADCLFCAVSRTLPAILKKTNLSRKEVKQYLVEYLIHENSNSPLH